MTHLPTRPHVSYPYKRPTMSDVVLDARCHCRRCTDERYFVMRHHCYNCNSDFEAKHRFGDRARTGCPLCGAHWVHTTAKERIATEDQMTLRSRLIEAMADALVELARDNDLYGTHRDGWQRRGSFLLDHLLDTLETHADEWCESSDDTRMLDRQIPVELVEALRE